MWTEGGRLSLCRMSTYGVLSCQEGARVPGEDKLGLIHPACGEHGRGPCLGRAGLALGGGRRRECGGPGEGRARRPESPPESTAGSRVGAGRW